MGGAFVYCGECPATLWRMTHPLPIVIADLLRNLNQLIAYQPSGL